MKFTTSRSTLLKPIQAVIGVVERRQTMPILANVLLVVRGQELAVTATDLEVELVARVPLDKADSVGEVTVPGRKLLDICRALPEGTEITLNQEGERMLVRARKSRFTLSTLPATEFPTVEEINAEQTLQLAQKDFKRYVRHNEEFAAFMHSKGLVDDFSTPKAAWTDGWRYTDFAKHFEDETIPSPIARAQAEARGDF
jgi:DNA polymerase-3 subunit beta